MKSFKIFLLLGFLTLITLTEPLQAQAISRTCVNGLCTYYVPINTRGTYLNYHPDDPAEPATAFDLRPLMNDPLIQLREGDIMGFEQVGSFALSEWPAGGDDTHYLLAAVFYGPSGFLYQGPATNAAPAITWPTYVGNIDMNIDQDFYLPHAETVYAQVPQGATSLLFTVGDGYYGDNSDPNGDYQVLIKVTIRQATLPPTGSNDVPFEGCSGVGSANIAGNSVVNANNRSVSESVPVVGQPFYLNYQSYYFSDSSDYQPVRLALGGWVPSILHKYSPAKKILYMGNGNIRNVEAIGLANGGYSIVDTSGAEIYYFDSEGQHVATIDAVMGHTVWSFQYYQGLGWLDRITDQFGRVTYTDFTEFSTILVSPYGQRTTVNTNPDGTAASIVTPSGAIYQLVTENTGRLLSFTRPEGQQSQFTYDARGYLLKDESNSGSFIELIQSYNFDTQTQTVIARTANNISTTYATTRNGNQTSSTVTEPSGAVSVQSSNTQGENIYTDTYGGAFQGTQAEDPRFGWLAPYNSSQNYVVPNSNINIISSTTKSVSLSDPQNPLSLQSMTVQKTLQNDPNRVFTTEYDAVAKLLVQKSPLNRTMQQQFNSQGLVTQMQVASLVPVQYAYTTEGLLTNVTQGSRVTQMSYDEKARVSTVTNALGQTQSFEYDEDNRPVKLISATGLETLMSYDNNGNLTSLKPAGRMAHAFTYNLFNLAASYLPPVLSQGSTSTEYAYNVDKQLTQIKRPDNSEINFVYNSTSAQLEAVNTAQGSYITQYIPNSNLVSQVISPDNQVTAYSYAGSYKTSETNSGVIQSVINYLYNTDGTLAEFSVQNKPVALGYDRDGLLTQVGELALTRNNFGAVTVNQIKQVKEELSYNNFGELIQNTFSFKNKTFQFKVTRDSVGRVVATEAKGVKEREEMSYEYDGQGRLIQVKEKNKVMRAYVYDAKGNRIKKQTFKGKNKGVVESEYDEQDRLTRSENIEYRYNLNGELIEKLTEKESHHKNWFVRWLLRCLFGDRREKTVYTYTAFGNLKSVTLPNGRVIEYLLDAQNRRIGKMVNGVLKSRYVYISPTQIGAELNSQGEVVKQFIYATKVNIPDYVVQHNKTYRVISDQVGTPMLVVDANSGKVVEEYSFDEFGVVEDLPKNPILPFGFAGGLYDDETGLVHFGMREYDAEMGRWTTKDPIGFNGGDTNLYGYVANDPVNGIDPTGKYTELRCRPLDGIAGKVGRHCYLVIFPELGSGLGSSSITLSLFNEGGMGIDGYSTGVKSINDIRDTHPQGSGFDFSTRINDNIICNRSNNALDTAIYTAFNNMPTHSIYSNNPFSDLGIHNSNSFIREILSNAGAAIPTNVPNNAYGF